MTAAAIRSLAVYSSATSSRLCSKTLQCVCRSSTDGVGIWGCVTFTRMVLVDEALQGTSFCTQMHTVAVH